MTMVVIVLLTVILGATIMTTANILIIHVPRLKTVPPKTKSYLGPVQIFFEHYFKPSWTEILLQRMKSGQ
jgi:hypothetical protein